MPRRYAAFGHPVVPDRIEGYAGPLAGLHAGLGASTTPLLVTVPCDSPFLPLDLVARLRGALEAGHAQLAVAKTGDQAQPVFSLVRRDVLDDLAAFLARRRPQDRRLVRPTRGGRSILRRRSRSVRQHQYAGRTFRFSGSSKQVTSILQAVSCIDDYDPNALPVAMAQQIVEQLVEPVIGTERLFVRNALGRVLAEDVISPIDVPAHNNSAMDGYGVRAADLAAEAETP